MRVGSTKITADGDCSHEIKRHLFLGRKVMPCLDSILKIRRVHGTYVYTDPPVTGRELPAGLRVTTSRDVSPRPALDTHGQRDSAMVFPFAFASLPVSELC